MTMLLDTGKCHSPDLLFPANPFIVWDAAKSEPSLQRGTLATVNLFAVLETALPPRLSDLYHCKPWAEVSLQPVTTQTYSNSLEKIRTEGHTQ